MPALRTANGEARESRGGTLRCQRRLAAAVLHGITAGAGIDLGAAVKPIAEDLPAAAPAGFQGLLGPRGVADDLKKLVGVSGTIEKKLNDMGIFHFWQFAEMDGATAHHIGEEVGLPGRADGWVAQSKELSADSE